MVGKIKTMVFPHSPKKSAVLLSALEVALLSIAFILVSLNDEVLMPLVIAYFGIIVISLFASFLIPFDDLKFILIVCIVSFLLRAFLAFLLHPYGSALAAFDQSTYDRNALNLASGLSSARASSITGHSTYVALVALIYSIFGHTPIGAKVVNGILGVLTVMFVYLTVRDIYGKKPARTACLLTAFFPSFVLWSALLLKDTLATFLIVLAVWSTVKLHSRFRVRYIAVLLMSIVLYMRVRYFLLPFIVAAILSSFLIRSGNRLSRNLFTGVAIALIFALAWQFIPGGMREAYDSYSIDLDRINAVRSGFAGGGSKFLGDVRINSYPEALKFLPLGLLYFFLGPFPWQVRGFRQMMTVPEVLAWYCLVPFMIYGIIYAFKSRFAKSYVIMATALVITIAYTFGMTNMGSLHRYRAQAFIFFLIFAAVGIVTRRDRRLGIAGSS